MFMSLGLKLLISSLICSTDASYTDSFSVHARSLFVESMSWMDNYYDATAGYLYEFGSASALRHDTRSSVYYALGLLARDEGSDVDNALQIIKNVIYGQFKDPNMQWYGDYQKEPEEPLVGSPTYPAKIYNSWDPNWRGFIGTALIVAVEEFGHLISPSTTDLILQSLHNSARGDEYCVGGIDGDNLYPSYTNPSLMRAFVATWVGRRLNDSNLTISAQTYTNDIVALFDRANTLSEFNSGTYTGVSLYALSLWVKYNPEASVMHQSGVKMITATWQIIAQLWHPDLKNLAGPWDRSYGFDMNRYLSLMALHIWNAAGRDRSGLIPNIQALSHVADFSYGPVFAILAHVHDTLLPDGVVGSLSSTSLAGEHMFESSALSPPYDTAYRAISTWLAPNISIGAETFNQTVIGGPAINQHTFNPAIIQWNTGSEVGFITLFATEPALTALTSPNMLNLTYPRGTHASVFSFIVSTFKKQPNVASWNDIRGLKVNVSGNVNAEYSIGFAGAYGGKYATINDFEFWNFTYTMPVDLNASPHILLEVTLEN